jgi:hypothetical protein
VREKKVMDGIIQDEQRHNHVEQTGVDISRSHYEYVGAQKEDAGVQMLGCVAISLWWVTWEDDDGVLEYRFSAVAAVVNAMKASQQRLLYEKGLPLHSS